MPLRRTLTVVLASAALVTPGAAQAEPSSSFTVPQPQVTQPKQDLRSPDTRDAGGGGVPDAQSPVSAPAPAPAAQHASDGGSSVPVIPLVAGAIAVLLAALAAFHGIRGRERVSF